MRYIFVALLLAAAVGCSSDDPTRPLTQIKPTIESGYWLGTSWAQYPGPADEPLEAEEQITFHFDDSLFYYHWGSPDVNGGSDSGRGSGTYVVSSDSILTLSLESYDVTYAPFYLDGEFSLGIEDSTLILEQIPPSLWMTRHRVTVEHIDVVF